jgi:hypothetical protein
LSRTPQAIRQATTGYWTGRGEEFSSATTPPAADRNGLRLRYDQTFEGIHQIVDQVAQSFFDPVGQWLLASVVFTHAQCLILEYGGAPLHVNRSILRVSTAVVGGCDYRPVSQRARDTCMFI